MILKLESADLRDYLARTDIIDFDHPDVSAEAAHLAAASGTSLELVKNSYEFVRDAISHSADINGLAVTCKASEVLQAREGLCYAKSHLLAALLRKNQIPAGFCYQVLRSGNEPEAPLVLHGLAAVYIQDLKKWIRLDPRGNKDGIEARFCTGHERLAYQVRPESGEKDFAIVFTEPDDNVVRVLTAHEKLSDLWPKLPQYPAKMEWCKGLSEELAKEARRGVNPVGYCGHHCGFCFLSQWCGGCRSAYNHCSYAVLNDANKCPNVSCAKDRNLNGCYECAELADCGIGYYERADEYIAKASALFISKHGEECYANTLKRTIESGVNYPETFDSSGSVLNALAILEMYIQSP